MDFVAGRSLFLLEDNRGSGTGLLVAKLASPLESEHFLRSSSGIFRDSVAELSQEFQQVPG